MFNEIRLRVMEKYHILCNRSDPSTGRGAGENILKPRISLIPF